MANINPCLECVTWLKSGLEQGHSMRQSVQKYLSRRSPQDFAGVLAQFIFCLEQGANTREVWDRVTSPHRRALLHLIQAGIEGQPVHERLGELEKEILFSCEMELKQLIDVLPFRMLVPLLFFQFPAFLLLLFGPLLNSFLKSLNS